MRRLVSLLAAIVFVATVAPMALAHEAPPHGNWHYAGDCFAIGHSTHSHGLVWLRNTSHWTAGYTGSRAEVVARVLKPCTNGRQGADSGTMLLGANLQRNGANDFLAQLGIGAKHLMSGVSDNCTGVDDWVNTTTTFIYTPWPNPDNGPGGAGIMCRAGWVDFNNNGTPDSPVNGVRYLTSITIEIRADGTGYDARFCVTRDTDEASDCIRKPIPSNTAQIAWWACEAKSAGNQLGVVEGAQGPGWIAQSQYRPKADGVWWYTQNSPNSWNTWEPSGKQPYYERTFDQEGSGERVNCYTQDHVS